ncbi:aldehyde dehydrogenase family protein [Streptomyces sp. ISL-98]|uniref:aldehyde dehydrogenase family protein n=1 Tax=Streptomyces sp. ISL-98 TaxID=2819192 RepID=UPI001BE6D296|nr:aldehyde dehydrogenase family protein [Streptomyces sp. ISL-98]MBT2507940.1 aldehyde dehydrogenase family protein [Streptomyces sp. ISL-98]
MTDPTTESTTAPTSTSAETFSSRSPATGEVIAEYPVHGPAEVQAAVVRARGAARHWAAAGWAGRRAALLAWKRSIARRMDEFAEAVVAETGKPVHDARAEVLLALVHLDWAARNARRVLGRRRVASGVLSVHQRSLLAYRPLGVVGVIGPWNYPVHTPMGSIGYALAAGNAVVFKPSERTPGVGVLLASSFGDAVPEHTDLLQTVTGPGATGAALAGAGGVGGAGVAKAAKVDKVAFTGSPGTARKVAAQCAKTLTPLLAECGGKDAVLVGADSDLDAAAEAIVWGAMSNAGQTCAGVERVYVVESAHAALCERIVQKARELAPDEAYGPLTLPGQLGVVERHMKEALAAGARAPLGGPESLRPPYVHPVVLVDVPEDSPAMTEETFGPVVVVNAVRDLDDAVARTNASAYSLGAAVFTGSRRAGLAVAERLDAGAVSVNSMLGFAAVPTLPFGGAGESGYGRIHGAEGLRAFAAPRSITVKRFSPYADLTSFGTPREKAERAVELGRRWHARR